ncbi:hypothetical protein BS47DRAFT_1364151 [Hydnum rufescens UP504]|uniref:Uncharacterized protein n=1 Tax=Hydnum rufescens UP504 TaxID=1448309 RepID=A0A9P6AS53_9AGAM|nr:hypothetical protein BS47DRAFT_1364151 [Hydnum rufescens UP504]
MDPSLSGSSVSKRKRNFDDRFLYGLPFTPHLPETQKKRGKRPAASSVDAPDTEASTESGSSAKKAKSETPLRRNLSAQYEKEVKGYQSRSLKDQGIGVRPLVK